MPDPRPFSSLRFGQYDEPPAASPTSTPRTRQIRLQRALRATADIVRNELDAVSTSSPPPPPPTLPRMSTGRHVPPRRRPRSPPPDPRDPSMSGPEADDSRRRRSNKRRRLDTEPGTSTEPPIRYGFYGQVEPGRLKLQIVSCDGGEHRDVRHPATYLGPHNVLKHDQTVYCSERSSTSLVLRHADDMPFCLDKLHIVGPENGFTAPVREGLVYVAMTLGDLRKHMDPPPHAQRAGAPPHRRRRSSRSSPERLSLSEALRDPEISSAVVRRAMENGGRDQPLFLPTPDSGIARRAFRDIYDGSDQSDGEANCEMPPSVHLFDDVDESNPDDILVTLLSDEEPGPEENSSQDVIDFRQQRMRSMRRRLEHENWDRDERWGGLNDARVEDDVDSDSWRNLVRLDAMMGRTHMTDSPQSQEPEERSRPYDTFHRPYSESATEHARDPWNDPNVTRARFHIRTGKHKVAIKFDPPVSGRFILLKLWAGRSNVDVQTVIAKGYGGSRFFPALEFR